MNRKFKGPMQYVEPVASPEQVPAQEDMERKRALDMGFGDDSDEDFASEGEPTPLARDVALHDQNSLSELEQLLQAERASTKDAMDKLREAETEKRNLQKKFEQLKSSTSGQMSFMRKKLEEKYQAELDEVDAELEESREEGNALRMQIHSLAEHIQEKTGQAAPILLEQPTGAASIASIAGTQSRQLDKLKKELQTAHVQMRKFETEVNLLRQQHIPNASAGVEDLKQQLLASEQKVASLTTRLQQNGALPPRDMHPADSDDSADEDLGLEPRRKVPSELSIREREQYQQEIQALQFQLAAAGEAVPNSPEAAAPAATGMDALMKARAQLQSTLQASEKAAEARATLVMPASPKRPSAAEHNAVLGQVQELEAELAALRAGGSGVAADVPDASAVSGAQKVRPEQHIAASGAEKARLEKQVSELEQQIKAAQDSAFTTAAAAENAAIKGQQEGQSKLATEMESRLAAEQQAAAFEHGKNALEGQVRQLQAACDNSSASLAETEAALVEMSGQNATAVAQAAELEAKFAKSEKRTAKLEEKMQQAKAHMEKQQAALKQQQQGFGQQLSAVRSSLRGIKTGAASIGKASRSMREDYGKVVPKVEKHLMKMFTKQIGSYYTMVEDMQITLNAEVRERRKLFNTIQELKGNIRVFCRCRPMIQMELDRGETPAANLGQVEGEIIVMDPKHRNRKSFEFDAVFGGDATGDRIFEDTRQLVQSCCDGYNICIFAYGQTGSGKTYTMEGTEKDPGINYRALQELFALRRNREKEIEYTITISLLEIYCEQIRDLLATDKATTKLEVKQAGSGTYVPDLTAREVTAYEQVIKIMQDGQKTRATASTNMNEHSSRSHCMLQVFVTGKDKQSSKMTKSKLSLVDLAGCERISRSGATGQQLKEATSINSSLSALGDVVASLQGKSKHIPYRNSTLTHLLADSLGGESKCLMFINMSPSITNAAESINSLNFATRCRATELGQAKKNVSNGQDSRELAQAKKRIADLEAMVSSR